MRAWHDLLSALGLLSRLPLPDHPARGAPAAWAWPLAGAILGGIAAGVGAGLLWAGLPAGAVAVLVLAVQVGLSGGLHEDGLADTADGLWGGHDAARRLEIMKDSRIGSYGVIALVLMLLGRWYAVTALLATGHGWALVGAAALSRGLMPMIMATVPPAREGGLSRAVGIVSLPVALGAAAIGLLVAVGCMGATGLAGALAAGALAWALCRIAIARIGGQTGDILGASQQLAELAVLFAALSA